MKDSNLLFFNPENDIALAADVKHFTPPAPARCLREDLQLLPLWIASPGDAILASPSDINQKFVDKVAERFPSYSGIKIYSGGDYAPLPWGWSKYACFEMRRRGAEVPYCDPLMDKLRILSSRLTAVGILNRLDDKGIASPPIPMVCHTVEQVIASVKKMQDAVLKTPWSSSGRGVIRCNSSNVPQAPVEGALRRQGAIVCEKWLDKKQDFAMEFFAEWGRVKFLGYSVFFNNRQMSYDHALVASTTRLEAELCKWVSITKLQTLRAALVETMEDLIPEDFYGYFGVDMMIYADDSGEITINPCVELNLRTTMGVISSILGNRVVSEEKTGVMRVLYHRTQENLRQFLSTLTPPKFQNHRLVGGSLLLSPAGVSYTADLTIAETPV